MYSEELIKEVKRLYPGRKGLYLLAEMGSADLGTLLRPGAEETISLTEILAETQLHMLQTKARLIQSRFNLYNMWQNENPATRLIKAKTTWL